MLLIAKTFIINKTNYAIVLRFFLFLFLIGKKQGTLITEALLQINVPLSQSATSIQ